MDRADIYYGLWGIHCATSGEKIDWVRSGHGAMTSQVVQPLAKFVQNRRYDAVQDCSRSEVIELPKGHFPLVSARSISGQGQVSDPDSPLVTSSPFIPIRIS